MKDELLMDVIQEKTGISQRGLASLIGTSQSILSRYMEHTRSLPTFPLIAMAKLYVIVTADTTVEEIKGPSAEDKVWLNHEVKRCRVQVMKLEMELDEMIRIQQQAATLIEVLNKYAATETLTEKRQRWIEILLDGAREKLQKNGWLQQKQMRTRIAALVLEAEAYEEGL